MTRCTAWLLGALSGCLLLGPAAAQIHYVPTDESRVWIEGSATTRDFTCSTQHLDGRARLPAEATRTSLRELGEDEPATPALHATVPVRTLDCGRRRQNRDLYEAMKADEHPAIHYELLDVEVVAEPDSAGAPYVLNATGRLTVAGVARTVSFRLEGRRLADGRVRARGSLPLKMTDFGIDPPTALLGLIRVRDDLVVHFDITADEQP